jgi:hypothetical protein
VTSPSSMDQYGVLPEKEQRMASPAPRRVSPINRQRSGCLVQVGGVQCSTSVCLLDHLTWSIQDAPNASPESTRPVMRQCLSLVQRDRCNSLGHSGCIKRVINTGSAFSLPCMD